MPRDVTAGAYATDTVSLTDRLALTVSARYNHTHAVIEDLSGDNPDLNGVHSFSRLNPAVGLAYQWTPALNVYGGYNESTRSPTAVELACASPDAPCKLPNEFVADPDLKQVVAKNWEAGLRGSFDAGVFGPTHWKAGVFRTTNVNDIIFQATGGAQSNEGFFANVGDTRRQGVEASITGKMFDSRLDWFANYTFLDATFLSPFSEISANHPDADPETGLIDVQKGDKLPGLPRNAFKIGADYAITPKLTVGGDMMVNSSQYYRGDEANLLPPLGGFAVVNLRARVSRRAARVAVFARAESVRSQLFGFRRYRQREHGAAAIHGSAPDQSRRAACGMGRRQHRFLTRTLPPKPVTTLTAHRKCAVRRRHMDVASANTPY